MVNLLQIFFLGKFEKKSGHVILSMPAVLVVGYILVLCYTFFRNAKTRESWWSAKSEQEHHMISYLSDLLTHYQELKKLPGLEPLLPLPSHSSYASFVISRFGDFLTITP